MIILGPGDLFGDTEFKNNNSKFSYDLVCNLNNSEIYTCPLEVIIYYLEIQYFIRYQSKEKFKTLYRQ
jgi:hypothetical protein